MPVPVSNETSVQQSVDAVLARVDRRPRLSVIWGGIAIAAVAVGALTSALMGENPFKPQLAETPSQSTIQAQSANDEPLLIALDKPLVSIAEEPEAGRKRNISAPSDATTIR